MGGPVLKKKSDINVLAHHLVPDMKVLSESEAREVLKKYSVDNTEIPRAPKNDPAVQALNAKVGDVIKISRAEETGKWISYRVVSER